MNWIPYVSMAGRAKENVPEGSLKYLFVYLKIRIFKCSYRMYIYIYIHTYIHTYIHYYHSLFSITSMVFIPPFDHLAIHSSRIRAQLIGVHCMNFMSRWGPWSLQRGWTG